MIKISTKVASKFVLKAIFDSKSINEYVIKTKSHITEFVSKKQAFIYLGKKDKFCKGYLRSVGNIISKLKREYQVDITSFVTQNITSKDVVWQLVESYEFNNAQLFSRKTSKQPKIVDLTLINLNTDDQKAFKKATILTEAKNYVRNLQITPSNILHSEEYAQLIQKEFSKYSNIVVQVLNKKQIIDLKMGLLLSVNKGSAYEPRVVILEYVGDFKSIEKTVMVGKGITFDAGGMNLKNTKSMLGMKYDMSGSAIVAGTMKVIAQLKPKLNVATVMVVTDNMINSHSSKPDDVWVGMNGKSVEINNTDAEGRLVLADGLTYGVQKLKATRLIDVATLTGAIISALGNTYTGVWSTTEKGWEDVQEAAKKAHELVWRMPLHKDYFDFMKKSTVADFKNVNYTGKGGASSAAMFLTQFNAGKEHIHMDIAGTADVDNKPTSVMLKTLFELVNK